MNAFSNFMQGGYIVIVFVFIAYAFMLIGSIARSLEAIALWCNASKAINVEFANPIGIKLAKDEDVTQ